MKTIVFCADGTWNGSGNDDDQTTEPAITNVLKLFLALDGQETVADWHKQQEQEKRLLDASGATLQTAKYIHGVGDSSNLLVKLLGGVFGAGLITRIVRGYTFVSRSYEPGDKIVLVGFSRGAYTARALGGMIASQGLLSPALAADPEQAYKSGSAVWQRYSASMLKKSNRFVSLLAQFARVLDELPGFMSRPPDAASMVAVDAIEAIGVWDTVGSLGIPASYSEDKRVDALRFVDTVLNDKVKHGFHGIAIDERRADFTPTLWNMDERIKQVLFPGAHADVGGGYGWDNDESGLSDVALNWMIGELAGIGVRFALPYRFQFKQDPDGYSHAPWTKFPFTGLAQSARDFPPGLAVHASTARRVMSTALRGEDNPAAPYRPANLKGYYDSNGQPWHPSVLQVDFYESRT